MKTMQILCTANNKKVQLFNHMGAPSISSGGSLLFFQVNLMCRKYTSIGQQSFSHCWLIGFIWQELSLLNAYETSLIHAEESVSGKHSCKEATKAIASYCKQNPL